MKTLITTLAVFGLACTLLAQTPITLSNFEGYDNGATVMFQAPSFSGSTSSFLDASPNFSGVTNVFPAGNPNTGLNVYNSIFSFKVDATTPWLRLTTAAGTSNAVPNPTIAFFQTVKFDMFTDRPLFVALLVRETGTTADIGANGGGSGGTGIEFIGGTPSATANKGHLVSANTWTTLSFDLNTEPVTAFTGNGILSSPTSKGTLEALGISPEAGASGTYNIYLDNFQVVPEPSVAALLGLGALALVARTRRQRA